MPQSTVVNGPSPFAMRRQPGSRCGVPESWCQSSMRKHHQIAAAHDKWLALTLTVHPGLSASNEVKDRPGSAGGIERPGTAVAALLEDAGAQAKAVQDIR